MSASSISLIAAALLLSLTSCETPPASRATTEVSRRNQLPTEALAAEIEALSPSVRRTEAQRLALCAQLTSAKLARDYHAVAPALLQNLLVNTGFRRRGLCYQWTEDLLSQLQRLKLDSLDLQWGVARAGTLREHNCAVVTAKGDSFQRGIVLDPWRYGGRLFWRRVPRDYYPWQRDDSPYARSRLSAAVRRASQGPADSPPGPGLVFIDVTNDGVIRLKEASRPNRE
ncbi:MAG: hypothetical protein H0W04_07215 [Chthoniobacterales bacterium]|nr:hypothetical protein [Chthoniobacterales bacterium]